MSLMNPRSMLSGRLQSANLRVRFCERGQAVQRIHQTLINTTRGIQYQ